MTISVLDHNDLAADAIVVSRIVDAASQQPRVVSAATVKLSHAYARIATGSYLVISGRPDLVVPKLATTGYTFDVELEFPDRGPLEITVNIPLGQALPYEPAAFPVELLPVTLSGTVTKTAYPYQPIPNARVTLTSPWPLPSYAAVRIPVALARPAGTTVTGVATAPAGAPTTLAAPSTLGATAVTLQSTAGCVVGGALMLGAQSDAEHALVAAVDAVTKVVSLSAPLRRSRPAGVAVQPLTVTLPGSATALARDVEPGDGVLELGTPVTTSLIRLDGASPELRALGTLTDAAGRWRIDGVRAIGRVALTISAGGYTTAGPTIHDIDYRGGPNRIVDRLA